MPAVRHFPILSIISEPFFGEYGHGGDRDLMREWELHRRTEVSNHPSHRGSVKNVFSHGDAVV
jgi:hypothetical protein